MTDERKSGFKIKIDAFVECDASDAEGMQLALQRIGALKAQLEQGAGMIGVELTSRYMIARRFAAKDANG